MSYRKNILATACSTIALSAGALSAAENEAFGVATLRDRPLDEYIELIRAGAVDERSRSDFSDNYADDAGDGFFFAPGVMANGLDIQEPRIVLRGFGLGNNQHRSTVNIFRDGAPLTDVHGTTNFSEINLQSTQSIEIYRGVANLREGGDNLGGAVNFISETGLTARQGVTARADGGAAINGKPSGQAHIAIAHGVKDAMIDYYASLTGVYENGFRDNNMRVSEQFHGNVGFRFSDRISSRIFLDVANSETELAGGLELAALQDDPDEPAPPISLGPLFPGGPVFSLIDGARQDDFARDIREGRVANETNFRLLGHEFELGGHYTRREVESPQTDLTGFIDEEGSEWRARLQAERSLAFFGGEALYRVGGAYSKGSQDSDRFENVNGVKGDVLAETEHRSKNISGYVQGIYRPFRRLIVDVGAKFVRVERDLTDFQDGGQDTRNFTGVAARGGAAFKITDRLEIYASASRAYEPPSFYELIAGDPTEFNGLDEQDSFTIEAGLRGSFGDWVGWDVVYYDTDVENEIINTGDPSSFVNGDVFENVDATSHKGVEAGVDLHLFPESLAARNASFTLRSVYNYNNFRFMDADPIGPLDGNRLAGAPVHLYRGELRYTVDERWFVAANVTYTGGDFFADHVNGVEVPTGAVLGFSAGFTLNDRVELYASGENITDRAYVAGVTPVISQTFDNARIFAPGARAALYGGLRYKF